MPTEPIKSHADQLVLTIDVGSSSIRTNLFTSHAQRITSLERQSTYDTHTTQDGGVEIDPGALLKAIVQAIDAIMLRARASGWAENIRAVGICSLVSTVLGVSSDLQPTTPIYTWADTRCAREASELRHRLDQTSIHERTGCYLHSSYLPARLLWLKHTLPGAYANTVQWLTLGDWLYLNLFGRCAQSLSVASWSGLLNRHTFTWDKALLSDVGVDEGHLPSLAGIEQALTGLRGEYALCWPELRDVPWFPCISDGVASNLGSGCYVSDAVAMQVGTSSAVRALAPGTPKTIPDGLWCYRLDPETSLLGGALSEGGNLLSWLRRLLNVTDFSTLGDTAALLPPDAHGLTFLPFPSGERSLGWHDSARATVSGLSLDIHPAHVYRAAQEAIAYRLALVYDRLITTLPPTNLIVASGGALLGTPGWMGILADVIGKPVTASTEQQASSKGVALLALRSLGVISDFSHIPAALGPIYTPDPQRHSIYRQAMQRQQDLYERLLNDQDTP